jgi:RND family efflux transporter MFP subunit
MQPNVNLRELAVRREAAAPAVPGPRRQWLSRYLIPLALLLGVLALAAWAAQDLYLPRYPVTVVPVHVSRTALQKAGTPLFKAAGWVEPRPTPTRVAALASGVVKELLVVEDDAVQAGQIVAYLVKDEAELSLQSMKAKHKLASAELDRIVADLLAAETNLKYPVQLEASAAAANAELAKVETMLAQLPFDLKKAQAQLLLAKQELESKKSAGAVVAAIELDRAVSKLNEAQAQTDDILKRQETLGNERKALSAKASALAKKLELKTDEIRAVQETKAKKLAAEARLEEAGVAVAEAELRLERMAIKSPIAGRVLQLVGVPGASVAVGNFSGGKSDAATIITLYKPDHLQLRVDVRFDNLAQVRPKLPVRIESGALGVPLSGKVLFISSLVNIQKNTVEVKVGIDNPPPLLKPEMLVDATFLAPDQPSASKQDEEPVHVLVPRSLVQGGDRGHYLWVADTLAGVARKQPVELGPAVGDMIEVTKGLDVSSKLIVTGREALSDGSRIQITGEEATLGADWHPGMEQKQ